MERKLKKKRVKRLKTQHALAKIKPKLVIVSNPLPSTLATSTRSRSAKKETYKFMEEASGGVKGGS